jgi:hypothetical protein
VIAEVKAHRASQIIGAVASIDLMRGMPFYIRASREINPQNHSMQDFIIAQNSS